MGGPCRELRDLRRARGWTKRISKTLGVHRGETGRRSSSQRLGIRITLVGLAWVIHHGHMRVGVVYQLRPHPCFCIEPQATVVDTPSLCREPALSLTRTKNCTQSLREMHNIASSCWTLPSQLSSSLVRLPRAGYPVVSSDPCFFDRLFSSWSVGAPGLFTQNNPSHQSLRFQRLGRPWQLRGCRYQRRIPTRGRV